MTRLLGFAACLGLVLVIGACTDDPATPRPPYDLPEPSSPANVLLALERIYEDSEIDPAERARGYATLLAPPPGNPDLPAFRFRYGFCDIECPWEEWGYTEEVELHETMFRRVHRIELDLTPSEELDFFPGQYPDFNGWKMIISNDVRIRIWLNESQVIEKRPTSQFFIFAPVGDRWYLAEWRENLSSAMWGDFKREFANPLRPRAIGSRGLHPEAILEHEVAMSSQAQTLGASLLVCCIVNFALEVTAQADVIHVPGDYPTIKQAIGAAGPGSTILVAPGTYTGPGNINLDFGGIDIELRSEEGADVTIIDCEISHPGLGFNFHSGETSASIVDGFTITRGGPVGIRCRDSSPTIRNCTVSWSANGGMTCDRSANR